jgi:hypothetical protein
MRMSPPKYDRAEVGVAVHRLESRSLGGSELSAGIDRIISLSVWLPFREMVQHAPYRSKGAGRRRSSSKHCSFQKSTLAQRSSLDRASATGVAYRGRPQSGQE